MQGRLGVLADEGDLVVVTSKPARDSAKRIGSVEHQEIHTGGGCCLHRQPHGGEVGVEAGAHVLEVEHHHVEITELVGARSEGGPVEAHDGCTGGGVHLVGNGDAGIRGAANAVFWSKGLHQRDLWGFTEQVDQMGVTDHRGVVRNEAHPPTFQLGKVVVGELLRTGTHRWRRGQRCIGGGRFPGRGPWCCAGDRTRLRCGGGRQCWFRRGRGRCGGWFGLRGFRRGDRAGIGAPGENQQSGASRGDHSMHGFYTGIS